MGVHLVQHLGLIDTPRRSWIAEIDRAGVLMALREASHDDDVVTAVGDAPALVVVDAPLAIPDDAGRRDVEAVLTWLDVAAFPVSRARLVQLCEGVRGEAVAPALVRAGHTPLECVPDQVLRQVMWESRPDAANTPDLAGYRAAWLGLRPPRYRPKGAGRAMGAGLAAAFALLCRVVDMAGWAPRAAPGDWEAIADAGVLDAVACAYAARRDLDGGAVRIGSATRGLMTLPCDVNLRERVEVNLARLRHEGAVRI